MDKIAIIGANGFQEPLIRRAAELGLETHVFAWEQGAVGRDIADRFYPISVTEKDEILSICRTLHPVAVTTIGSDLASITAAYISRELGLCANSAECVYRATNKYAMRRCFLEHGIPVPGFTRVTKGDDAGTAAKALKFPLIVKPTDSSGSRCITLVEEQSALDEAVRRAQAVSREGAAIVEEYISGEEYSLESISQNGRHHFLAVTKKFTTDAPHYIETGHMEPSDLPAQTQERAWATVKCALDALGVTVGAAHSEFRVDSEGGIHIIEIGARMGGDCIGSSLVPLSTGCDFVGMVIDAARGRSIDLSAHTKGTPAVIRFLMSEAEARAFPALREKLGERMVYFSGISPLDGHPVTDSSSRYGYFICRADTPREALEILNA